MLLKLLSTSSKSYNINPYLFNKRWINKHGNILVINDASDNYFKGKYAQIEIIGTYDNNKCDTTLSWMITWNNSMTCTWSAKLFEQGEIMNCKAVLVDKHNRENNFDQVEIICDEFSQI